MVGNKKDLIMTNQKKSVIDLMYYFKLIVNHYPWFVLSLIISILISCLFLRLFPRTTAVSAMVQLIEKSSKQSISGSIGKSMLNSLPLGLGSELGGSFGSSLSIDSEKEILTSNSLVRNVILDLSLYTEYRLCNWGKKKLLYHDQPISVSIDSAHLHWFDEELPVTYHQVKFVITKTSNGYRIETILKANKIKTTLPDQVFASLPAIIKTDVGTFSFTENETLTARQRSAYGYDEDYKLEVTMIPPVEMANLYIARLSVAEASKKVSNIMNVVYRDENVVRGIDFLNNLCLAYNQRANDEKDEEARRMDEFVNKRLAQVDAELGSSDTDWEQRKKQYQITLPEIDAEEVMTKKSLYEATLVEIGTQLQLHDYLSDYINNPDNLFEVIPVAVKTSLGTKGESEVESDATQSISFIARHNSLVTERKELLRSMSEKSPQIRRITESIRELHPTIMTAMDRDRKALVIKRQNVEREYAKYMGRVSSAPQMERVLTEIGRQREIKQGVYLLMLQKREETAMELAKTSNKSKFIDKAAVVKKSTKPETAMVFFTAILLGVLFPLILLILYMRLKNRIDTLDELKRMSVSPILGTIAFNETKESICSIRANLLQRMDPSQKVIMVASCTNGDSKSYVARMLSDSLVAAGKDVVYCSLDFRGESAESNKQNLSELLSQTNISWPEMKTLHPADLLAHEKMARLIAQLKEKYGYVVLDVPALDQYSDVNQVASMIDVCCLIVRPGITLKSSIESLLSNSQISNPMFIINATNMKKKCFFSDRNLLSVFVMSVILASCGSSGKVAYLQNAETVNLDASKFLFDARIMPKDILTITVNTIDPKAAIPFNLTVPTLSAQSTAPATTTQPALQSYLVSNDGTISFPILGVLKVSGLTKEECERMLQEKIRPFLAESEDPIVTVRMSSFSISVLGEVQAPGSFQVSREKITIFEALAQAGDMTIYGVRDKVRLVREDATGKKEIHTLNLNDANITNSPYYYLQQNDIVYVEPSNVKKQDARVGTMTTLWFSATGILVSIASLLVTIFH